MSMPTFPDDVRPDAFEWGLISNTQTHTSPLSGDEQTLELPGARWSMSMSFEDLTRDETAAMEAFLIALRGAAKRFRCWHLGRERIRGSGAGNPVINGAGQTGALLATRGWVPSAQGVLLPGDYIGAGGELKMVVATVNADAEGVAQVAIEPPLRYSPANSSPLVLDKPTAIFRAVDDNQLRFIHRAALSSFSLTFVETFA